MRRNRFFAAALVGLTSALAGVAVSFQSSARADSPGGPLPHVPKPPNVVPLEPVEQLGKDLLFDNQMSDPPGYACAQCHAYSSGFTTGLSSVDNLSAGVPPGVVPGRWDNRKAQGYAYATFSPEGPYYNPLKGVYLGGNFWDGRAYDTTIQ